MTQTKLLHDNRQTERNDGERLDVHPGKLVWIGVNTKNFELNVGWPLCDRGLADELLLLNVQCFTLVTTSQSLRLKSLKTVHWLWSMISERLSPCRPAHRKVNDIHPSAIIVFSSRDLNLKREFIQNSKPHRYLFARIHAYALQVRVKLNDAIEKMNVSCNEHVPKRSDLILATTWNVEDSRSSVVLKTFKIILFKQITFLIKLTSSKTELANFFQSGKSIRTAL